MIIVDINTNLNSRKQILASTAFPSRDSLLKILLEIMLLIFAQRVLCLGRKGLKIAFPRAFWPSGPPSLTPIAASSAPEIQSKLVLREMPRDETT